MRTGLQTLEDEKKAIVNITNELAEDQIMNQLDLKDLDTIQSKFVSYEPNGLFAINQISIHSNTQSRLITDHIFLAIAFGRHLAAPSVP